MATFDVNTYFGTFEIEAGEKHRVGEYPNRRCTVERLFWNEKRRMWQATEPGTRSEVWETIRGKMR